MQNSVDSETHRALFAPRLNVNIACTLIKSVLQQPVGEMDDVLVIGV